MQNLIWALSFLRKKNLTFLSRQICRTKVWKNRCAANIKPPHEGSTLSTAQKAEPKVIPTLSWHKDNVEKGAQKNPMYSYREHDMNHIAPHDLGENPQYSSTQKKPSKHINNVRGCNLYTTQSLPKEENVEWKNDLDRHKLILQKNIT